MRAWRKSLPKSDPGLWQSIECSNSHPIPVLEGEPFQPLLNLVLCRLSFGILGILAYHLLSVPVCPSREGSGSQAASGRTSDRVSRPANTSGNKTKNK